MLNDYLLGLDDLKTLHQYLHDVPYDVIRNKLYTCYDLFDDFDPLYARDENGQAVHQPSRERSTRHPRHLYPKCNASIPS